MRFWTRAMALFEITLVLTIGGCGSDDGGLGDDDSGPPGDDTTDDDLDDDTDDDADDDTWPPLPDDDADDDTACEDGERRCVGTRTAYCDAGEPIVLADCADDGWICEGGRCVSSTPENATMAAYRERLDELRYENARNPVELDRFGGWMDAPASLGEPEPGDYFRVKKLDGTWWFITPDGHPFVSKGVTDVNWWGATLSDDRWHDIIEAKYGDEDTWADAARDRATGWRFNTIGPWSSHSMSLRMPHAIIILDSAGHAPRYPGAIVTDYWSEDFAEHALNVAQVRAGPYVTDENLLGLFLDNELVWGADHFRTNNTLLQLTWMFPDGAPGRDVAIEFVRDAAGSIAQFNATWQTSIADWSELPALPPGTFWPRNAAARTVTEDFMVFAFRRYAEIAIGALREVDPNHLILGCRYHTYPGDAMVRAAADYFDVISMAFYNETPPTPEIDAIFPEVDKPFFIEEWSFKAMDSGYLNIQAYAPVVATQKARALAYDGYVETFMARPYAIGYHWYKWMDNPWRGIADIFSGDNFGLLDPNDDEYEPFVRFVAEVNHRVEWWHAPESEQ